MDDNWHREPSSPAESTLCARRRRPPRSTLGGALRVSALLLLGSVVALGCDASGDDPVFEADDLEVLDRSILDVEQTPVENLDDHEPSGEPARGCPDPDEPGVSYWGFPVDCVGVNIHCAPGWENLPPRCGCGCEQFGLLPAVDFAP
ncbi:MAG: hypothetical protein K0V04_08670 [Deltaproteobacteria bacterium]|nr:hypothetical protein [Deltaproteobacteria bacterium]